MYECDITNVLYEIDWIVDIIKINYRLNVHNNICVIAYVCDSFGVCYQVLFGAFDFRMCESSSVEAVQSLSKLSKCIYVCGRMIKNVWKYFVEIFFSNVIFDNEIYRESDPNISDRNCTAEHVCMVCKPTSDCASTICVYHMSVRNTQSHAQYAMRMDDCANAYTNFEYSTHTAHCELCTVYCTLHTL